MGKLRTSGLVRPIGLFSLGTELSKKRKLWWQKRDTNNTAPIKTECKFSFTLKWCLLHIIYLNSHILHQTDTDQNVCLPLVYRDRKAERWNGRMTRWKDRLSQELNQRSTRVEYGTYFNFLTTRNLVPLLTYNGFTKQRTRHLHQKASLCLQMCVRPVCLELSARRYNTLWVNIVVWMITSPLFFNLCFCTAFFLHFEVLLLKKTSAEIRGQQKQKKEKEKENAPDTLRCQTQFYMLLVYQPTHPAWPAQKGNCEVNNSLSIEIRCVNIFHHTPQTLTLSIWVKSRISGSVFI